MFRPSDDACIYPLFVPANHFAVQTLIKRRKIAADLLSDTALAVAATEILTRLQSALAQYGMVQLSAKTKAIVRELDNSRQTTGMMTRYSTADWVQDIRARSDGSVAMHEPQPGFPFFIAEGIGQYQYLKGNGFNHYYRRAGDQAVFREQAPLNAQGTTGQRTMSRVAD